MTEEPVPPSVKSRAEREREERLARALRDNLRRRKQQSRARDDLRSGQHEAAPPAAPDRE
ncbi:hypothetical protein NFI95_12970 [Acetobacteraceae bacterium KSS8]|uniref:Uncharacterized protein n=1 Tax=Endosaccharibacter trunci TaxID=2812733 RepID=A0ABT1W9C3_9PROT|nr:hypothetical protein [Acetobacteraceae bacterium KSS8]